MATSRNRLNPKIIETYPHSTEGNITFECAALIQDALETDQVWRIKRITDLGGGRTTEEFAGRGLFEHRASDRELIFSLPGFANSVSMETDGIIEYMEMEVEPTINSLTVASQFTWAFWVRRKNEDVEEVILSNIDNTGKGIEVYFDSSNYLHAKICDSVSTLIHVRTSGEIVAGSFHFFTMTYSGNSDASGVTIYCDEPVVGGAPTTVISNTLSGTIANTQKFNVARRPVGTANYGAFFLDEFSFWSTDLDLASVTQVWGEGNAADLNLNPEVSELISWWRMGDQPFTSPIINDIKFSNDMTMRNMDGSNANASIPTGFKNIKSLKFNAGALYKTYVEVSSVPADLDWGKDTPFTASMWIKPTSTSPSPVFWESLDFGANIKGIQISSNRDGGNPTHDQINFSVNDGSGNQAGILSSLLVPEKKPTDNGWYHIVCTYDAVTFTAADLNIYVDGVKDPSPTINNNGPLVSTGGSGQRMNFGRRRDGNGFHSGGWHNQFTAWNQPLTEAEVIELYNSGIPKSPLNHSRAGALIHWWELGGADAYPTVVDRVGTANAAMGGNWLSIPAEDPFLSNDTPGEFKHYSLVNMTTGAAASGQNALDIQFEYDDGFSFGGWIRASDITNFGIMGKGGANNFGGWWLQGFSGGTADRIRFIMRNTQGSSSQTIDSSFVCPVLTWFHVMAVNVGGQGAQAENMKLFINGVEDTNTTIAENTLSTTIAGNIAFRVNERPDGSNNGNCNYDNLVVYNKTLSAGEVSAIYNNGQDHDLRLLSSASNLIRYWRMGEDNFMLGNKITDIVSFDPNNALTLAGATTEFRANYLYDEV
jgi:hypothetical protein